MQAPLRPARSPRESALGCRRRDRHGRGCAACRGAAAQRRGGRFAVRTAPPPARRCPTRPAGPVAVGLRCGSEDRRPDGRFAVRVGLPPAARFPVGLRCGSGAKPAVSLGSRASAGHPRHALAPAAAPQTYRRAVHSARRGGPAPQTYRASQRTRTGNLPGLLAPPGRPAPETYRGRHPHRKPTGPARETYQPGRPPADPHRKPTGRLGGPARETYRECRFAGEPHRLPTGPHRKPTGPHR